MLACAALPDASVTLGMGQCDQTDAEVVSCRVGWACGCC